MYDGQVILVIEGLQYFTEFDSKKESEIKFWLPRYFPKNIRVIISADKKSKSYASLVKRNCQILEIDRYVFSSEDTLSVLRRKSFIMPSEYVDTFIENMREMAEELEFDRTTVKSLASTFCPYETPNILTKDQVDASKIATILQSVDLTQE